MYEPESEHSEVNMLDGRGKEAKVEVRYDSTPARCCSSGCKLQGIAAVSQGKGRRFYQ